VLSKLTFMHRLNAKGVSLLALLLAMGLRASASLSQNLLSDSGFESGASVAGGVGGWETPLAANFSQTYAHSGQWSMECYYSPSSVHGLSQQLVSAVPGATYDLTGFGFTPATLGSQAFASLVLYFTDSGGHLLGADYTSSPIDSSSSVGSWLPLSISQDAPANAINVFAEVTMINDSPGDAVYFDDLTLSIVPEPSLVIPVGLGFGSYLVRRSKRDQSSS
jgi:hypothetical protein